MHPAASIVIFTSLTGAGYGLLFWLGLTAALERVPQGRLFAAAALAVAVAAVTAGLISSVFHLGRPERAWRAFSQWRSSWLSREGVAALATFAPTLVMAWGWIGRGTTAGLWAVPALATAAMATVTVVCTAYIYRSLTPIAAWSNGWVPPNFLALAAMTGAAWLAALMAAGGYDADGALWLTIATIIVAAPLKFLYWRHIDRAPARATAESATGLGAFGEVRLFEAPHTAENYVLKEMGFRLARKHRNRLRRLAPLLAFALPLLLAFAALASGGWVRVTAAMLAAPVATLGVLVERWLFFAEARHTVTLYYGAARA